MRSDVSNARLHAVLWCYRSAIGGRQICYFAGRVNKASFPIYESLPRLGGMSIFGDLRAKPLDLVCSRTYKCIFYRGSQSFTDSRNVPSCITTILYYDSIHARFTYCPSQGSGFRLLSHRISPLAITLNNFERLAPP